MTSTLRAAALTVVLSASVAHAQETAAPAAGDVRVGIGLSMNTSALTGLYALLAGGMPATELQLPIELTGRSLRLEPSFGWSSLSLEDADARTALVGLGAFYLYPLAPQVRGYGGLRISVAWTREEERDGGDFTLETTGTDWSVAATVGAEYQLSPAFALGLEGQLRHLFIGDRTTTAEGVPGEIEQEGGGATTTEGFFCLRAYFN